MHRRIEAILLRRGGSEMEPLDCVHLIASEWIVGIGFYEDEAYRRCAVLADGRERQMQKFEQLPIREEGGKTLGD